MYLAQNIVVKQKSHTKQQREHASRPVQVGQKWGLVTLRLLRRRANLVSVFKALEEGETGAQESNDAPPSPPLDILTVRLQTSIRTWYKHTFTALVTLVLQNLKAVESFTPAP